MARSDIVLNLVRTAVNRDMVRFKQTVEALIAEEQLKNHHVFAKQLSKIMQQQTHGNGLRKDVPNNTVYQLIPNKSLSQLILSQETLEQVNDLIEEHNRKDLLRSYNLEPKNRVLLYGPPGNGKTSLAEAISEKMAVPLYVLKYEDLIESYLGNTAKKLDEVFEFVKTENCVLFVDEFESIGKERDDQMDNGEIKRIVSSLLLQIDNLPPHVLLIAATNHTQLVDKAFWRRFQLHMNLPNPDNAMIVKWFDRYQSKKQNNLGMAPDELSAHFKDCNFSEIESFAIDVMRKHILQLPKSNIKDITESKLNQWSQRLA